MWVATSPKTNSKMLSLAYENRHALFERFNTPFGRPLLSMAATAWKTVLGRKLYLVWYRNGMWIHRDPDGYMVERHIMLFPISRFGALTSDAYLYTYRPKDGDVVIDCGAGTGWEALLYSRLVGQSGLVVAIEAHPITFKCLAEVCRRNSLTSVIPLQCAVADKKGVAIITDLKEHQTNTIVAGGDQSNGMEVTVRTIDDIVAETGRRVDFIGINIEGAELAALEGATETLKTTQHVAVSCNDFMARDWGDVMRTKSRVRQLLQDAGFRLSTRPEHPNPAIRDFLYGDR